MKCITKCSKGIKFFYSAEKIELLRSFADASNNK